jgi:hypothetical protein
MSTGSTTLAVSLSFFLSLLTPGDYKTQITLYYKITNKFNFENSTF